MPGANPAIGPLTPEPVLYQLRAPGFEFFGVGHLVSLGLSLALVTALVRAYLRLPDGTGERPCGTRLTLLRAMAGTSVTLVASKCAVYLVLGMFEPLFWPLHVCNLCELAALGYTLSPHSPVGKRLADLLFCWGTIGCLGALLFPGWAWYCPAWSAASICGFVEHALVLACALCVTLSGDYHPQPQRIWFVVLASITCGGIFRVANPLLGTNFFFVTNPEAVGGPFPWMVDTFGDPGFLVPYLVLSVAFWTLAYGCVRLCRRSSA